MKEPKLTPMRMERSPVDDGYIFDFFEDTKGFSSIFIPKLQTRKAKDVFDFIQKYREAVERNYEK